MKRIGKITIAALAALGLTASAPSFAQRHFHGGARVGVYVGVPWYGPAYYPPASYDPPAYYPPYPYGNTGVVPGAPATYVERVITEPQPAAASLGGPPGQAQAQAQWWHYCQDSQSFYPYVQQCASPWQLVAPQPQR